MMNRKILGCALLMCMPMLTLATEEQRSLRQADPIERQSQTAYWLSVQREGTLASPHVQVSTPTERELTMQRWLESHSHPIPEFFDQEVGGEVGQ